VIIVKAGQAPKPLTEDEQREMWRRLKEKEHEDLLNVTKRHVDLFGKPTEFRVTWKKE
jgi:predicted house-cleaning NTP pyrophosphatase (Maf/HAM1 superfamily)